MKTRTYQIFKEDDKYIAKSLTFTGAFGQGKTEEKAIIEAVEAEIELKKNV